MCFGFSIKWSKTISNLFAKSAITSRQYEFINTIFKISNAAAHGAEIYKAVGCEKCFHTGYRGRIGIYELMMIGPELKSLILKSHDANRIMEEARKLKMVSLRQAGIQKVLNGITTIEEVLRVTQT